MRALRWFTSLAVRFRGVSMAEKTGKESTLENKGFGIGRRLQPSINVWRVNCPPCFSTCGHTKVKVESSWLAVYISVPTHWPPMSSKLMCKSSYRRFQYLNKLKKYIYPCLLIHFIMVYSLQWLSKQCKQARDDITALSTTSDAFKKVLQIFCSQSHHECSADGV